MERVPSNLPAADAELGAADAAAGAVAAAADNSAVATPPQPTTLAPAAPARRPSTDAAPRPSSRVLLERVLSDMEALGIVTQLGGRIVGGVALGAAYYAHALALEGRADEVPPCQLLIARHEGGHAGVALVPATQAELEGGDERFPREAPVLSKVMSPAAMRDLHWARVPAVAIFGCFAASDDELLEASAAGVPISPSMCGPHVEELRTQMEVFLRQHPYPAHRVFILRDFGFLIFGSDLPDALAAFDEQLKDTLVASTEAGDVVPGGGGGGGGGSAPAAEGGGGEGGGGATGSGSGVLRRSGSGSGSGSGSSSGSKAPLHAVLSNALKRLQTRVGLLAHARSEPTEELAAAAAGLRLSPKAGGGGGGNLRVGVVGSAGGAILTTASSMPPPPQPHFASEPSTPMLAKLGSGISLAAAGSDELLPDSIRTFSSNPRRTSETARCPSFQTGFKPW